MLRTRLFTTATSLDLSGIITDETGTGSLVFNTNPTLISPTVNTSLTSNGFISITDATPATSTTTGALRVAGGVGIGGALNTGADAFINGVRVGIGPAGTDNTVLGVSAAGVMNSGAAGNTVVGRSAGRDISDGDNNVFVGVDAGQRCTSAVSNVALGFQASQFATTANNNVAIGSRAAWQNAGSSVVAIGTSALSDPNTTSGVVAIGNGAGTKNRSGDIVAIGQDCLDINTLGTANVAVGRSALGAATTAIATVTTTNAGTGGTDGAKTAIQLERDSGGTMVTYPTVDLTVSGGAVSGTVTVATGGSGSTSSTAGGIIFKANAAGIAAGVPADWRCQLQTVSTAASNTAVGHQAGLSLTTGTECTYVGALCGDAATTGGSNTGVGSGALGAVTTSASCTAIGRNALLSGTTGIGATTAVGASAGSSMTTATNAVAIGQFALLNASTATQTTAIGSEAGRFRGSGTDTLTSATSSIYIGYRARASANSVSNEVVIAGTDGLGDGSNTTVIGNTSTTSTRIPAGNLTLSNGNLILGTAGNGISFAATTDPTISAVAATGFITRTATNVANNDTVTIGTTVYTFKTTLTPADYEVLIGADASASLTNLRNAILGTGGTPGTDYVVPNAHPSVTASAIVTDVLPLVAITAGTAGDSIALAETSAQLTVSGATLQGGRNAQGMTSELLDDYEQGTWSPQFNTTDNNLASSAVIVGVATYTKIGKRVFVDFGGRSNTHTTAGATGNLVITGLPYAVATDTSGAQLINWCGAISHTTNWSIAPSGCNVTQGTTRINLSKRSTTSAQSGTVLSVPSDLGANNSQLILSVSYLTN